MSKKYYITTPIYYVNDVPHIGHAYTTIACDVIARFKRLDGFEVHFLTGTDEHGQKIERAAEKASLSPLTFTDKVSIKFRELMDALSISNSDFIRTTEDRHVQYVQKIWKRLVEKDAIYLGKYAGWYDVKEEAFFKESDLIDGKSPDGNPVEWVEETSHFFRLSEYQDRLLDFYRENPSFIQPESRKNEVISFVKSGLHDLSVSRSSFSWGIQVPDVEGYVIYVWLDALFNYISGAQDHWPADLHMVGKDILRFHCVYWPAFLMALDIPLPKRVFAHGWWLNDGKKISKSLGNVIDPIQLIEEFGLDYVRYFLMREVPFGNDGSYSREVLVNRINAELANNIGNLSQRILSFIYKNCDARIPEPGILDSDDNKLLNHGYLLISSIQDKIDSQALHEAIGLIVELSSAANVYVDSNAPWNLKKTDVNRMNRVLYVLAEVIRVIAILLQPFIPDSALKILKTLNIMDNSFLSLSINHALNPGHIITIPEPIFPRIEVRK